MRRGLGYLEGALSSGDESGIALILVLIVMATLSIMLVVVISYSDSSSTSTCANNPQESAYNLAEAGVNDAYSVISVAGTDTTVLGQW